MTIGLTTALVLVAVALAAQVEGRSVDPMAALGTPAGPPIEGDDLTEQTLSLGSKMRCPVCQGASIADSPSQQAVSMLGQVRDLFAAGYSETQILEYFERSYGEFIRLQPRARGFNLIVWLAPLAAVLGGGALVAARARSRAAAGTGSSAEDLDAYLEQVRSEVRE
ncbi:MAG: cytochrome c-type biogenesis protein [Acidobacteriota bacterium]|nr:cytochrome c-type biogenesis protein [Acidobacteriota bacterium]